MGLITTNKPKCLVEIAGVPVIDRILNWLNLPRYIVNLHWQADQVISHLTGRGIHCSIEAEPLGTAGGIRKCYNLLDNHFFIVYGDVLTNMDLSRLEKLHLEKGASLTMVSYRVNNPNECGIITEDKGRVLEMTEKPAVPRSTLANGGIIACRKEVFLCSGNDISADIIPQLLVTGKPVYHTPIQEGEFLMDMGTQTNYVRCCEIYGGIC